MVSAITPSILVRKAVASDLDDISEIGVSSFPLDPQWNYRYPYREQYPEEHRLRSRKRWSEWLSASFTPDCMILVAEGPSNENASVRKVLAFSIWKLPTHFSDKDDVHRIEVKPPTYSDRRDANHARMQAYRQSSIQAEKRLFDPRYGNRRMDLAQLVTDPAYQRRGLASILVQHGQQIATEANWAIGVFASPMGQRVYQKRGFRLLGTVVAQAEGDDEVLEFPAMAWEPVHFWYRKTGRLAHY